MKAVIFILSININNVTIRTYSSWLAIILQWLIGILFSATTYILQASAGPSVQHTFSTVYTKVEGKPTQVQIGYCMAKVYLETFTFLISFNPGNDSRRPVIISIGSWRQDSEWLSTLLIITQILLQNPDSFLHSSFVHRRRVCLTKLLIYELFLQINTLYHSLSTFHCYGVFDFKIILKIIHIMQ